MFSTHVQIECNTATGFIQGALSKVMLNTELMFDHLLYIKGFTSTFVCRNHVRNHAVHVLTLLYPTREP